MANMANELASTLQAASVKRNPDPSIDVDPSTSASTKRPVKVENVQPVRASSTTPSDPLAAHPDDEIPLSVLRPARRTHNLPPLPDLRFEQSYLARIKHCESPWSVAWVTFFDHVMMPLTQGVVWNLAVFGWRAWNRDVKFQGRSVGARVRRWWWRVNKWDIPRAGQKDGRVEEFFVDHLGSGGD